MKKEIDALQSRLMVLRNLSVSSFGTLSNTASLNGDLPMRAQFPDLVLWGKVNGAMMNIRKRYDSYRTLVTTLSSAASSDGAIALAQSMISHIEVVHEWLHNAGVQELAEPYRDHWDPLVNDLFAQLVKQGELVPTSIANRITSAVGIPGNLPALPSYWYCIKLAMMYASVIGLRHSNGLSNIVREITFPPEYQQAGLAILNYFSVILADKYPNIPVAVSIKQEPNLVTLIITLPDGTEDIITKTLNDYGLVVTGQMSPRNLVNDDLKALALEQKLELAHLEIRQTRDILRIQDQYSEKRIGTLESEVQNLYALLGREFTSKEKLRDGFIKLSETLTKSTGTANSHITTLLNSLSTAVADRNAESTKLILEDIQAVSPDIFAGLSEFFLSAATSGIIGNAVYDWIKVFLPLIPKG